MVVVRVVIPSPLPLKAIRVATVMMVSLEPVVASQHRTKTPIRAVVSAAQRMTLTTIFRSE
jgi:hypothetical protein